MLIHAINLGLNTRNLLQKSEQILCNTDFISSYVYYLKKLIFLGGGNLRNSEQDGFSLLNWNSSLEQLASETESSRPKSPGTISFDDQGLFVIS